MTFFLQFEIGQVFYAGGKMPGQNYLLQKNQRSGISHVGLDYKSN